MQIHPFRQVQGIHQFNVHDEVEGAADLVVLAGPDAGIDAPFAAASRQTGQRVVQSIAVLVQPVAAGGQAAQLQRVLERVQVHAPPPVRHSHMQVVLVVIRGQRDTDTGLFTGHRGGKGIVATLVDALLKEHPLPGQTVEGLAGDVDANFVPLGRGRSVLRQLRQGDGGGYGACKIHFIHG